MIFHTKYPKKNPASLRSAQIFYVRPPNLKSWVRPCLPPVVCSRELMSYLHYLCLFAYSGVQLVLCLCFVLPRLVHPMLPVSLDCLFLTAPSVFCNFYLK